jgi:hypothetical protein
MVEKSASLCVKKKTHVHLQSTYNNFIFECTQAYEEKIIKTNQRSRTSDPCKLQSHIHTRLTYKIFIHCEYTKCNRAKESKDGSSMW